MWVITSWKLEKKKGVIFYYSKSRNAQIANNLMKDYKNVLVTDGYAGYNELEKQLTHAECWAHARTYFYESVPLDNNKNMIKSSDGYTGVKYIDKLFEIESKIEKMNIEEKLQVRKEKSEPVFKKFYEWVNLTSQKYITNNKLKKSNYICYKSKRKFKKIFKRWKNTTYQLKSRKSY